MLVEVDSIRDGLITLSFLLDLAAVISGIVVAYGVLSAQLSAKRLDVWATIFLVAMATANACFLYAFFFPFFGINIIRSLMTLWVALLVLIPSTALFARYARHRVGKWRQIYATATVSSLLLIPLTIFLVVLINDPRNAAIIGLIALALFLIAKKLRDDWNLDKKTWSGVQMYCPNCQSISSPKSKRPGSNETSFALLIIFFPAFFAYEVWRRTRPPYVCGACGKSGMIGVTTPVGKAALEKQGRKKPHAPAKYQVSGVDKASGLDVVEYIVASSPENAKVKVELKGVVVTAVDPV